MWIYWVLHTVFAAAEECSEGAFWIQTEKQFYSVYVYYNKGKVDNTWRAKWNGKQKSKAGIWKSTCWEFDVFQIIQKAKQSNKTAYGIPLDVRDQ